jgi:hypothetical protein
VSSRATAAILLPPDLVAPIRAPEFVSFHADRPAGTHGLHPNANLQSQGYMRMLDLLFRSARLFHDGAACTLLTTPDTRVRGVAGPLRRLDVPVDHAALMLSRSRAQLACVQSSDFARPMVLLDSDILLRGSLQPLFAEDFDVALTWRANKPMPVNGGLLVLHNRRPDVSRAFFERFLHVYEERYAADANAGWYGDQLALRDLVGLPWREFGGQQLVERDGCRIRLLPCDVWNFSPDNSLGAIVAGLPDKLVLHFKGQRKRLMEPFWRCFLEPEASWWPWARRRARERLERLLVAAAAEAVAGAAAGSELDAPAEADA